MAIPEGHARRQQVYDDSENDLLTEDERWMVEEVRRNERWPAYKHLLAIIDRLAPDPRTGPPRGGWRGREMDNCKFCVFESACREQAEAMDGVVISRSDHSALLASRLSDGRILLERLEPADKYVGCSLVTQMRLSDSEVLDLVDMVRREG